MFENTQAQSKPASTNGWDLVSAIRFPDVNRAIVMQKSSPNDFSQTLIDPDLGKFMFQGAFNDWQMSGGGGPFVEFELPIVNAVFSMGTKVHNYPKLMKATVQVNLTWLHAEGITHHLKVDFKNEVTVLELNVGENKESDGRPISEMTVNFMKSILQDWLIANEADFDHVFAKLDVAEEAAQGNLAWLKPTDKLYGITSDSTDPSLENKILGIMCMTEGNEAPGDHNVSPFAIPEGRKVGFLISPECFLRKMVLNGIPLLFVSKAEIINGAVSWTGKVTIDDFEVKDLAITNKVALKFNKQKFKDHIVEPMVDANKFFVRYRETGVEMDLSNLYFEYTPGISVHLDHVSQSHINLSKDRKFNMKVYSASTTASIKSETWVLVVEIVGSIAAAVLGAAAGSFLGGLVSGGASSIAEGGSEAAVETITVVAEEGIVDGVENAAVNVTEEALTEGVTEIAEAGGNVIGKVWGKFISFYSRNVAKFWLSLLGGALGGSTGAIATIIKAVANDGTDLDKMPSLDELGTEALSPITWPNLEKENLVIKSGGVNGSLQIGFDLKS